MLADMQEKSPAPKILLVIAVILLLLVALMYFVNPTHTGSYDPILRVSGYAMFRMPARSMEPTLRPNQYFVASSWPLASRDPEVGEVIVFAYPPDPEIMYVKRIVATGGSTIEMRGGAVLLDGRVLPEPWLVPNPEFPDMNADFGPVQVPEEHFFVLGDNRGNSADSRVWGFVPRDNVIGIYSPGD